MFALCEAPSAVAVIVTFPFALAIVVYANVALADPLATLTVASAVSPALFDCSAIAFTTVPAPAIVTVQLPDCPPVIAVGLHTNDTGPAVAVTAVAADELPNVAVKVTIDEPVNAPVLAVKLPLVEFAATVTLAGSVSAAELSVRVTTVPPAGAAADNVTVHDVLALVANVPAAH
jgi:hypothetical protein